MSLKLIQSKQISANLTGSLFGTASYASSVGPLTQNVSIVGNLNVIGTSSFTYSTASIVQVGSNTIILNTDNPATRFGGITVVDSGSFGNSSTGSIFWDSLNNRWIYSNPSGSSYDGGLLISGPRNTSGLGNEQGTTLNALMKGQGGDHITSSAVYEVSGSVGIGTTTPSASLDVSGSARFSSASFAIGTSFPYAATYGAGNDGIIQVKDGGNDATGNYKTQMWFRPAGNVGGLNGNYWGRIEQDSVGFKILPGRYQDVYVKNTDLSGTTYLGGSISQGTTAIAIPATTANVLINTTTDTGHKLLVTGSGTSGSLNVNGTLYVSGSRVGIGTAAPAYNLDVNGTARIATSLTLNNFSNIFSGNNYIGYETFRTIFGTTANTIDNQYAFNFDDGGGSSTLTSGTTGRFQLGSRFAPTSGTAVYNTFLLNATINQTGGANGITRALYINPTLTSAANFRAIETTRGNVLFQSGSTPLLFVSESGNVGIGTSTPTAGGGGVVLEVNGNVRINSRLEASGDVIIRPSGNNNHNIVFSNYNNYGTIIPATTNTARLGTPNSYWQEAYINKIGIGTGTASLSASLHIVGATSSSLSSSLLVQNLNRSASLQVFDDQTIQINNTLTTNQTYLQLGQGGSVAIRLNGTGQRFAGPSYFENYIQGYAIDTRIKTFDSSKNITFHASNDTELARITNSGSIGIGTSSPSASLHISGALSANLLRIDSPASSSILFVSGSGNVGIGTSNPTSLVAIQVPGDTPGDIFKISNRAGTYDKLALGWSTNGYNSYLGFGGGSGFTFNIRNNSSGLNVMSMGDQGAVIVGNQTGSRISVVKSVPPQGISITGSHFIVDLGVGAGGVGAYGTLAFGATNYNHPSAYISYLNQSVGDFGKGALLFGMRATSSADNAAVEYMRLNNTGNLGIGTTTDAGYKLDVNGSARIVGQLQLRDTGGNNGFRSNGLYSAFGYNINEENNVALKVGFGTGTSINTLLKIDNTVNTTAAGPTTVLLDILANVSQSANLVQWKTSTGTILGVINNSGSVGIGTSSPTGSLDVSGSARINGVSQFISPLGSTLGTNLTTSAAGLFYQRGLSGVIAIGGYSNAGGEIQTGQNGGISVAGNLFLQRQGGTVSIGTTSTTARLTLVGSGATSATTTFLLQNSTPTNLLSINDIGQVAFTSPTMSLAASQSAFSISPIISASAVVGGQYYGVNITPTFFQTTGSQTETAFRVAATYTGSSAAATGGTNIIADFGSTSAGSQLTVTDVTSGSIYMVNDVSGLPIIEATSDWGVKIYDFPRVVLEKTGSAIIISGSLTVNSGSITMPSRPAFRVTGSASTDRTNTVISGSMVGIDYNQGGYYNNTNGTFTAPIAGLYSIYLNARVGSANSQMQAIIYKNTNIVQLMWEAPGLAASTHFGVSGIVNLAVNDTLQVNVTVGSIQFDGNDSWGAAYIG